MTLVLLSNVLLTDKPLLFGFLNGFPGCSSAFCLPDVFYFESLLYIFEGSVQKLMLPNLKMYFLLKY